MKDQHTLIKGYRDLPQKTIDLMNKVKEKEREVLALIKEVKVALDEESVMTSGIDSERRRMAEPERWLATGKTEIEKGFMSIVRSIAQPLNLG